MSLIEIVHAKRADINRLAAIEEDAASDIDFLIDIVGHTSAWFPSGLALDLQDLLGRPVDVVTEKSLHWALRDRVLQDARPL